MAAPTTHADKVLDLVSEAGVLRPRDLDAHGIPRTYLSRLQAAGKLHRIGRGLYVLPDSHESIQLNEQDAQCFFDALAKPIRFNKKLTEALVEHDRRVNSR